MIFNNDGRGLLPRRIRAGLVQLQHDAPITKSSNRRSSPVLSLVQPRPDLYVSQYKITDGPKPFNPLLSESKDSLRGGYATNGASIVNADHGACDLIILT